jgi:hypothetical protein
VLAKNLPKAPKNDSAYGKINALYLILARVFAILVLANVLFEEINYRMIKITQKKIHLA